ncbi:MAG: protein-methionine-sulfoxide reductase catalytic subunit MsrP [Geminicoccaceae bacterium]|nr:protein-methionine-sulfoxide reductase catalytic subunit MsrP [Geminicoccaceae bacterium]
MFTRTRPSWHLPESAATDESLFLRRRQLIKGIAAGPILLSGLGLPGSAAAEAEAGLLPSLYPAKRDPAYAVERPITPEALPTTYNNFYEFGSNKQIWQAAQDLPVQPWQVVIDGLVDKPMTLDAADLVEKMPLEERVYRHRCVEAWSMVVPWTGFPLKALVDMAAPQGSAKYLVMQTFEDSDVAPGQRQFWYPWPYIEGLTIQEATNPLAFLVTGLYGKPVPRQNGAPLRLAIPWKYGFKSVKSIVRFTFAEERPVSFWEQIQAAEYGFWANVNPEVPHPRWSQAMETPLGSDEKIPTKLFNGYAEQVAGLYAGLEGETLYR